MSLCTVHFRGKSIGKQTAMNVILPDEGKGPFPVLYLLHGCGDDYTTWLRRTSIERYLANKKLIVVMVDGGLSFYVNSEQFGAYEDHLIKDIVGYVQRTFPASPLKKHRAIAGLSMGGFGAMLLGLKPLGVAGLR